MKKTEIVVKKRPFYKKAIGIFIIAAVAFYCMPELKGKTVSKISSIKNIWRKTK